MKFTKENVLNLTDKWIQNKINSFQDLQNEIKELEDTSEKVVVPKCFDEWFKEIVFEYPITDSAKRFALWKLSQQSFFGHSFEDARGKEISYETELGAWLLKNKELAIDAVLNGYIVEPEQLYYVALPKLDDADFRYLWTDVDGAVYTQNRKGLCIGKLKHTESEIKAIDERYWPFAVPVDGANKD